MKILLTGASGFVGTFFRQLVPGCVPLEHSSITVDIRNELDVRSAVSAVMPDLVVHLAAQSLVPRSFDQPRETLEINFLGTLNLLLALQRIGFSGRLLFVGSSDVYGSVKPECLPISEEESLKPRSPYAVSKVASEALCFQWSQTGPFEVVMTRSFNHTGPGQSEQFVVSHLAKQVIAIKKKLSDPVLHIGDMDVTRDFLDVRDVVGAYQQLLHRGINGETYNVCSGIERSVRSVLEQLLLLADVQATISQEQARLRPSEQRRMVGNPQKLKKQTSWSPQIQFETTLTDILTKWEETIK